MFHYIESPLFLLLMLWTVSYHNENVPNIHKCTDSTKVCNVALIVINDTWQLSQSEAKKLGQGMKKIAFTQFCDFIIIKHIFTVP